MRPNQLDNKADAISKSSVLLSDILDLRPDKSDQNYLEVGKQLLAKLGQVSGYVELMDGDSGDKKLLTEESIERKIGEALHRTLDEMYFVLKTFKEEQQNPDSYLQLIVQDVAKPSDGNKVLKAENEVQKLLSRMITRVEKDKSNTSYEDILPEGYAPSKGTGENKVLTYLNQVKSELATTQKESIPKYVFRLQGEFWALRFNSEYYYFKDSAGLKYTQILLRSPHKPIRSDELKYDKIREAKNVVQEDTDKRGEEEKIPIQLRPQFSYTDYTDTIATLEAELEKIELGTVEYHKKEFQLSHVKKERSRNFNLFGRERPTDSGEHARQAVGKAIARTKKKINKHIPDMFIHLERFLNTGFECIYDPPESELKSWQF